MGRLYGGAAWRNTRFTHEEYLEYLSASGLAIPILLMMVVGLRLECISIDWLHAGDLGMMAHIVGNTLWESVKRRTWGKSNQNVIM